MPFSNISQKVLGSKAEQSTVAPPERTGASKFRTIPPLMQLTRIKKCQNIETYTWFSGIMLMQVSSLFNPQESMTQEVPITSENTEIGTTFFTPLVPLVRRINAK